LHRRYNKGRRASHDTHKVPKEEEATTPGADVRALQHLRSRHVGDRRGGTNPTRPESQPARVAGREFSWDATDRSCASPCRYRSAAAGAEPPGYADSCPPRPESHRKLRDRRADIPSRLISNVGEALSDSAPAVRVSLLVAAPAQDSQWIGHRFLPSKSVDVMKLSCGTAHQAPQCPVRWLCSLRLHSQRPPALRNAWSLTCSVNAIRSLLFVLRGRCGYLRFSQVTC